MCLGLWAGLTLAQLCGCVKPGTGFGPETGPVEEGATLETVVRRINENASRMDFVLQAQGDADARHIRSDGKPEPFHGRVKLLFRKPRDLYMKLEHTLDEVMQIGSNSTEFWVWKRVSDDRYWWGRHDAMSPQAEADLPVRPDNVVEMFGLSEWPSAADSRSGPRFEVMADRYLLTFMEVRPDGTQYASRRVWVDRRQPYLIRELEYLTPSGRILTKARAGDFRWVKGSAVIVPWKIRLEWPTRGEFLEMQFADVERYDRDPARAFTSPLQQGRKVGEQIRVDSPRAFGPGAAGRGRLVAAGGGS